MYHAATTKKIRYDCKSEIFKKVIVVSWRKKKKNSLCKTIHFWNQKHQLVFETIHNIFSVLIIIFANAEYNLENTMFSIHVVLAVYTELILF